MFHETMMASTIYRQIVKIICHGHKLIVLLSILTFLNLFDIVNTKESIRPVCDHSNHTNKGILQKWEQIEIIRICIPDSIFKCKQHTRHDSK